MKKLYALMLTLAVLLAGCSDGADRAKPTPIIVDYSPTVSDVGALIYLLSNENVDVLAVTLPGTGEAGCEVGVAVTLGILAMFDRPDIPVACDDNVPAGANTWPEAFVGGIDALTLTLPDPLATIDGRTPDRLIADVVAAAEQPVVLYAVAPLTNVAAALANHPDARNNLARLVIMGGAVDVPGNVPGMSAEWNLWIDVPAAAAVLGSDVPKTLVPLDATNDVPTPGLWKAELDLLAGTEPIRYLSAMLAVFPAATSGGFYLWDELAAAVAAGEEMTTGETIDLVVVQQPGADYGATRPDTAGRPVTVALTVPDPAEFYAHFLSTVSGAVATPQPVLKVTGSDGLELGDGSTPQEILAFWLLAALAGDVNSAAAVVAADASWPGLAAGLGNSPDVFVAGSAPYAAFDIDLTCSSADAVAVCDGTWNDLWLAANPSLDLGRIRVRAAVLDGRITGFEDVSFSAEVGAAFADHISWLGANYPSQLAGACSDDGDTTACSALLVATATEWIASS